MSVNAVRRVAQNRTKNGLTNCARVLKINLRFRVQLGKEKPATSLELFLALVPLCHMFLGLAAFAVRSQAPPDCVHLMTEDTPGSLLVPGESSL